MQADLKHSARVLWYFANEREQIRLNREAGLPRPWTNDKILDRYRFCNLFRKDDRVSRWLIDNWYRPFEDHPMLWFSTLLARQINWPDTLEEIGFPETWDPSHVFSVMDRRKKSGEKVYTGAYIIAAGEKGQEKHYHTVWGVLNRAWKEREDIKPRPGDTLQTFHTRLKRYPGFGEFLAMEVALDLLETPILRNATDRLTWVAAGPGAIRGLNRVYGRDLEFRLSQPQALEEMRALVEIANGPDSPLGDHIKKPLDLADIEGCLCEGDKYLRINHDCRSREAYVPYVK